MNERIRELAEQAGQYAVSDNSSMLFDVWKKRYTEKFAELIVQDMLRLLKQYTQDSFPKDIIDEFDRGYLAGLSTAQKAVQKHFGVEEVLLE